MAKNITYYCPTCNAPVEKGHCTKCNAAVNPPVTLPPNNYFRWREESHKDWTDAEVEAYVAQARKQYHRDGEIEVDHNAVVSHGHDGGAYVLAWVWVDDDTLESKGVSL